MFEKYLSFIFNLCHLTRIIRLQVRECQKCQGGGNLPDTYEYLEAEDAGYVGLLHLGDGARVIQEVIQPQAQH